MSIDELISAIPQILLFIVPGFLILKMIELFTPKKKVEQHETILWSLLYSFVVQIIYAGCRVAFMWFHNHCGCTQSANEVAGQGKIQEQLANYDMSAVTIAYHLLIAIVFAFIYIKVFNSQTGEKITRFFNKNIVPGEDVWFNTLKTENGAWVRIYLNNGLVYFGMLDEYTSNPDESTKLISLTNFAIMLGPISDEANSAITNVVKKLTKNEKSDEFFTTVRDYEKNDSARVLLKYDDIVSIELFES